MTPNTITVYYGGITIRVVRGEHLPHAGADAGRVLVYPSPESARKLIQKDVPVSHRADVLAALERIEVPDTDGAFSEKEIENAQFDQDHHPDFSPYWDSRAGQASLEIAQTLKLRPKTTAAFRRGWHSEEMRKAREAS